jgi:hypothetical protein
MTAVMALPWLRSRAALAVLGFACLPLTAGGGCAGRTACFTYTKGEYAAHGNQCPASKDALANFTDPKCPGPVVAVNGAGTFDGEICCYPVTYEDIVPDCGNEGTGGQGGSFTSPPPPMSTPPACSSSCSVIIQEGMMSPCTGMAETLFAMLHDCANEQCSIDCAPFILNNQPVDAGCNMCLSVMCSTELTNCRND